MSKSLKDQLLALGLAPKKTERKPQKQHKPKPAAKRLQAPGGEISLDKAYRIRVSQERQEKQKAIALKREKELQRRMINQQIKALVKENALRDPAADCKRNFLYKGRIRSVLATREQINEINSGEIGIVYLSGNYHLLPADKVAQVKTFSADHVPDLSGADIEGEEENPVPDDLIW